MERHLAIQNQEMIIILYKFKFETFSISSILSDIYEHELTFPCDTENSDNSGRAWPIRQEFPMTLSNHIINLQLLKY